MSEDAERRTGTRISHGVWVTVVLGVLGVTLCCGGPVLLLTIAATRPKSPCEQLCHAIERGDIGAVSRQLADPENTQCKCRFGSYPINDKWTTPLHSAAREGDPKIVKLLLANGFDVNRRNSEGETPLWDAIGGPTDTACIKVLLDAKADLSARENDYQLTPLLWAVMLEDVAAVELLLQYGAPPDVQDKIGRTALHLAANVHTRRGAELAALLLKFDADPNVQDKEGCTALHYLGKYEQFHLEATAKMLVEGGADLTIRDDMGTSAGEAVRHLITDNATAPATETR